MTKAHMFGPGLLVLVLLTACAEKPVVELQQTREAIAGALDFEADIYAPAEFEMAQFNLENGEIAIAEQEQLPAWGRNYAMSLQFLELATAQAVQAQAIADANKANVFEQAQRARPLSQVAFQAAFEAVEGARSGPITREQIQSFEDELAGVFATFNQAEVDYDRGDFSIAFILLKEVQGKIGTAGIKRTAGGRTGWAVIARAITSQYFTLENTAPPELQVSTLNSLSHSVLLEEFGDSSIPFSLRLHDQLYHFTHGAVAALGVGHVRSAGPHLGRRVRNSHGKTYSGHGWKIHDVVTDEAHVFGSNSARSQDVVQSGPLVTNLKMDKVDGQLFRLVFLRRKKCGLKRLLFSNLPGGRARYRLHQERETTSLRRVPHHQEQTISCRRSGPHPRPSATE